MDWKRVDWECLRQLRDGFLAGPRVDYWHSEKELDHYDLAFAPRIAAKWRAVFRETPPAQFFPVDSIFFDWGCGTGTAARTLGEFLPPDRIDCIWLWDRSETAQTFAAERLAAAGVEAVCPESFEVPRKKFWLLVSHVGNELTEKAEAELRELLASCEGFVWVEPGTPEASRALVGLRERLRNEFTFYAPCPHQGPCGLLAAERAKDWCHHFAEPEAEFFTSAHWTKFSKELGIDLRSLPVSYLVAAREDLELELDLNLHKRVLGRPRVLKGHAKALVCSEAGVVEETLKASDGVKLKDLRETVFSRRLK